VGEHKRRGPRKSEYWAVLQREVQFGVLFGLIMASLYCAYVTVLYVIAGPSPFERRHTTLVAVLVVYTVSGLGGGLLYGLFHPLRRSLLGQLVVGTLIAMLVFFNIVISRSGLPTTWTRTDWEAVVGLGVLFGVILTFMVRRNPI
jgi:hypothetical protein